jgi:hypothetical protein
MILYLPIPGSMILAIATLFGIKSKIIGEGSCCSSVLARPWLW